MRALLVVLGSIVAVSAQFHSLLATSGDTSKGSTPHALSLHRSQLGNLYTAITLYSPGYDDVSVAAINDFGVVVGNLTNSSGTVPFKYTLDGGFQSLDTSKLSPTDSVEVVDINDSGVVLATVWTDSGSDIYLWKADGSSVRVPIADGSEAFAISISNAGGFTGRYTEPNQSPKVFYWQNENAQPVTLATGANADGCVSPGGNFAWSDWDTRKAWYGSLISPAELPVGPDFYPVVRSATDTGFVVGQVSWYLTGFWNYAAGVWTANDFHVITTNGTVTAANDSGVAVGSTPIDGGYMWTALTGRRSLSGFLENHGQEWSSLEPSCINSNGWIAGRGLKNGYFVGFLLIPSDGNKTIVPASSLHLMAWNPYGFAGGGDQEVEGIACDNPKYPLDKTAGSFSHTTTNAIRIALPSAFDGASNVTCSFVGHDGAEVLNPGQAEYEDGHVIYYPPAEFDENDTPSSVDELTTDPKRIVDLVIHAVKPDGSIVETEPKDIWIVRPPVVLVHGINSSADSWRSTNPAEPTFYSNAVHTPYVAVDHYDICKGNGPIEIATARLQSRISTTLASMWASTFQVHLAGNNFVPYDFSDYYGLHIAARRADLVAWSYGGVVARWYLKADGQATSKDWYFDTGFQSGLANQWASFQPAQYQHDVRKLVTLGSMWRGVPFASYANEAWLSTYPPVPDAQLASAPMVSPTIGGNLLKLASLFDLLKLLNGRVATNVPSIQVMSIGSPWLLKLLYGNDVSQPGSTANPFLSDVSYFGIAGDNHWYPVSIGGSASISVVPYSLLSTTQKPSWFPFLRYEFREGDPPNLSDGIVPVWSAILPGYAADESIVDTNHSAFATNQDAINKTLVALNNEGLLTGDQLNVAWNDSRGQTLYSRIGPNGRRAWHFAADYMAPTSLAPIYQEIRHQGRINNNAIREIADVQVVNVTSSSVTISWTTVVPSTTRLELHAISKGAPDPNAIENDSPTTNHQITVNGLMPGVKYQIRAVSEFWNLSDPISDIPYIQLTNDRAVTGYALPTFKTNK